MSIAVVGTILVVALPSPVAANHQNFLVPETGGAHVPLFWDANNNAQPDTGPINWYAKGTGWTSLAQQRFDAAGNEWDGDTRFNIDTFMWTSGTTNDRLVWRGNSDSSCPVDPTSLATAANLISYQPIYIGGQLRYYKLLTSCISFNESRYDFYFGSGFATGYFHWQGVLTHEMGHSVLLEHPYVSEGDPPCDYGSGDVDALPSLCPNDPALPLATQHLVSYWRRTLEPIDIHNADWVYVTW